MNKLKDLKNNLTQIETLIGVNFKDKNLLILAFVHRSFVNENKKVMKEHNERLEFLGDTTLNLIVSDYLYQKLPSSTEGKLSHIRSRLVDAVSCFKYFNILKLNDFMLLGKGEERNFERGKETIFSDAFEALLGAIYLDRGFLAVKEFILKNFENVFSSVADHPEVDYKGRVQEYAQKKYKNPPVYKVTKAEGLEHLKTFYIAILINNEEIATGTGSSKKEAEQEAAKAAYIKLNLKS